MTAFFLNGRGADDLIGPNHHRHHRHHRPSHRPGNPTPCSVPFRGMSGTRETDGTRKSTEVCDMPCSIPLVERNKGAGLENLYISRIMHNFVSCIKSAPCGPPTEQPEATVVKRCGCSIKKICCYATGIIQAQHQL